MSHNTSTPDDESNESQQDPLSEYEAQLDAVLEKVDETAGEETDVSLELPTLGLSRRDFMKAGAAVGAMGSIAGCTSLAGNDGAGGTTTPHSNSGDVPDHFVPPGEHDEYYGFWSGGHSGDIRIYGLPSMRELTRIPVFNPEQAKGYGFDNQTTEMLESAGDYTWGDSHHPSLSETDGKYDGKYLFVNDKAHGRVARVNLKYFETDAITNIPNVQSVHGCCIQSPDTEYVFANSEFRTPLPNDGRDINNPDKYVSLFTALDPDSMEVLWQVEVDGNLDILDTDKDGRWAISSAYNDEEGVEIEEMTKNDRDFVKAFDVPAIQKAVDAGNYKKVNGIPVVDGTKESSLNKGDNPIVRYVPTPKSPHCVEVEPNGKYAMVAGKLSPTVSIIDIEKLGTASDPKDTIVGQPKLGLGPLHTTYDGRGHAYTSLFIDSQVVKWDIETAINSPKKSEDAILGKIDVHYNPGHIQAIQAMSTEPTGDWLVVLNKLSKDRFLPVGPIYPDNDQLIYIGNDKDDETGGMELVSDHPVYPEPHDAIFAAKDKIQPAKTWDAADYEGEKEYVKESNSRVERIDEETVEVYTSVKRSEYGLRDFTVKEGDEVTLTATNIEGSQDIVHGLAIPEHNVHLALAPQDTREATFTADKPGVYWIYCTYFCSALHLEMRSRMIVEPRT
ncbi:nitrous-oxide reductase (plasmid) [Haloferax mediterranei ATCC 33500]|uniref:Nitrous-oxide reductase n=1 Tax=Haloferax mediterranei (strain ATCC 33500 / DSM 1411 / JCM 8866 / NBRC 14739 / NCIMB 2177 / R-4) TaxID=523841 RepID=I3R9L6_HALMT|nr:TAT-dependent nitrous-oxide reductase [Haloferax mediterranei]AFK20926.1 nitrous-oxide reductase [Haloferax mediterranei ATCC 33500]AHZ24205.1 nitrous oxide reductase [Haloferax mediterranei ATCC 33500]EMA05284.1 nitrous-oxide reductase [Haloferax mediterranei ATCC 33500]MDX5989914.1 TAT-dependent nitrous-oxide reductase [Haloferax mediterranei ATCC 33500]QCQ77106.1 nitrous-oxide reductase [Haloferax mediterranei ATCC 33500]